jgi:hypothetical protein
MQKTQLQKNQHQKGPQPGAGREAVRLPYSWLSEQIPAGDDSDDEDELVIQDEESADYEDEDEDDDYDYDDHFNDEDVDDDGTSVSSTDNVVPGPLPFTAGDASSPTQAAAAAPAPAPAAPTPAAAVDPTSLRRDLQRHTASLTPEHARAVGALHGVPQDTADLLADEFFAEAWLASIYLLDGVDVAWLGRTPNICITFSTRAWRMLRRSKHPRLVLLRRKLEILAEMYGLPPDTRWASIQLRLWGCAAGSGWHVSWVSKGVFAHCFVCICWIIPLKKSSLLSHFTFHINSHTKLLKTGYKSRRQISQHCVDIAKRWRRAR